MDYSLLIGVHDCNKEAEEVNENFVITKAPDSIRPSKNSQSEENRPDSDHDNFSPTDDTEDTDDDQLNRKQSFSSFESRFLDICKSQKKANTQK
jgi:hypothetical protein